MNIELWLGFVVASSIMLAIPGPTVLIVISYSLTHGKRANLPLLFAVILGTTVAVSGSLLGLGALLRASAFWFTVVKIMGGLYLLYLGISILRDGALPTEPNAPIRLDSRWKLFVNTFFATALNPKSLMFFVAFIPQFINTNTDTTSQLWILAITFITLATIIVSSYAVFASSAFSYLKSPRIQSRFNIASGSLLSLAGIWTLISKRPVS
ncbi:LysE family translocator [Psychrobium sp. nBUS_13]|uniref:LysE family translocator n=1 Tax=Psychrobium sp. nBUS_13 TaxID=3395319 RepID=UPI003EC0A769